VKTTLRIVLTACTAASLLAAPSARALTLVHSDTGPNSADHTFSTPESIAVDLAFVAPGTVTLTYVLDAEDIARGSASFNAIVDNFSGTPFGALGVSLDAGLLTPGTFLSNDGAIGVSEQGPMSVRLGFAPPFSTQAYLGDPFFSGAAADWTIAFTGLKSGDPLSLTVTAAVPEPASWAMLAGGLGLLARWRRRSARAG
jgi:hypothetical protein